MYIINQTQNPYAFHFACSHLHNIFTEYINSFNEQERRDIRNLLSQNIINRAEWFFQEGNRIACETFGKLCSRVWRLCWFDIPSNLPNLKSSDEMVRESDDSEPSLIDITLKLIDVNNNSLSQILIALTILNSILYDMSLVVHSVHIYKQKKILNSFKENHLLKIFLSTSSTLRKVVDLCSGIQMDSSTKSVINYGLDVIISILGFNYSGSFTDENYDDIGTIILRSKWIEALKTASLFFQIYNLLESTYSNKALEVLVFFSAIRSSILKSEESQLEFLDNFLSELGKILQYKINLDSSQNRHNLCRLFVRLKNNYRLDQFLKVKSTMELLNLYSDFCKSLFEYEETTLSTIFYVLSFWNRIAHGLNTIKSPEGIYKMIISILMSFLEMTIKREETSDTLLRDKILSSILELFPKLIVCGYEEMGEKILNGCRTLTDNYLLSCNNADRLTIIERQLAWVILFLNSIIFSKTKVNEEVKYLDSNLISAALNILKLNDERILSAGKTESSQYLELSIVTFLLRLSKFVFSNEYEFIIKFLSETHQIHSPNILLNVILEKIMFNLKMWGDDPEVIQETVSVLCTLSEGRYTHKLMLSAPIILQLIQNHNDFEINLSKKFRMNFFKALSELVLSRSDEKLFESYTNSFNIKLKYIGNMLENNNFMDKNAIINITYELRGILSSCKLFKHYESFFEWFHESSYTTSIIQRSLKAYTFKDWDVVWGVLRFIKDFTHNVHKRINFPNTSPNGIILFKENANILIFIASCINQFESLEQDSKLSDIKYKLTNYLFKIFIHIVDGDYCNYGVFSLYQDDILLNLFSSMFTVIFSKNLLDYIPFHPKIQESMYFSLSKLCSFNLNQLFSQDSQGRLGVPSETMSLIFSLICFGVKTRNNSIMNYCSSAIEAITNFHMKHIKKYSSIRSVLNESHQNVITKIIFELFDVILTERISTSYLIYKAIFCSIQLQPMGYEIVRDTIIKSQISSSVEKGERMNKLFQSLTEGIDNSFTKDNQEKFCDNISTFRSNSRQFIDIYKLYEYFHQIYSEM